MTTWDSASLTKPFQIINKVCKNLKDVAAVRCFCKSLHSLFKLGYFIYLSQNHPDIFDSLYFNSLIRCVVMRQKFLSLNV